MARFSLPRQKLRYALSAKGPVAAALALLALAGCAGADRGPIQTAAFVARYGDTDPHPGVAAARGMPIQGIDVSRHDGDIDWPAIKRSGISFAYLKTTEGGDYADPKFLENWKEAAAAGVRRGAYHFMYWCRPADQQALFFMVNVPNDADALPPVLDLEWNDASPTCPGAIPAPKAAAMIRTVLRAMQARTGKRPVIYTDVTFYRDVLAGGAFADYPFWLRSTASEPQKLYPGRPFVYWQFTATGRVPGIDGDVDRNVFNGTADDWSRWLVQVGAAPPAAPAQQSASR
jgi:lysozyme